jgi:arylsulfatase A-like enzyme
VMANYGGKVTLVDDWIGRLLAILDRRGLAEDTLVVFWSDHGEMGGDHGRFGKRVFYESSVQVPLIMRWPSELPVGMVTGALTEHVDLFDTLVDAADAPPSRRSFGRSLLPHARGEAPPPRDAAFSEFDREIMVRTERFKYALDGQGRAFLLHDMIEDPLEQRNLIGHLQYTVVERDLRERLLRWLVSTQVVAR